MLRSRSTVEILEYSKSIVIRLYREIGATHWMVMAICTVCDSALRFWKNERQATWVTTSLYQYPITFTQFLRSQSRILNCTYGVPPNFNPHDDGRVVTYRAYGGKATLWGYVGQLDFADETNILNLPAIKQNKYLHAALFSVQKIAVPQCSS
jgi:hypothetical protein